MNTAKDNAGPLRGSCADAAPAGISVVICSHNGASLLPPVLAHLAGQDASGGVDWEIIVIDNASTDDTGEVARRCWPASSRIALRVVLEPRLGLSYAKQRGIGEARYEFVAFVDDDSWLDPQWVRTALEVCLTHPEAGAIRGIIELECEITPPPWLGANQGWFGVWPDLPGPCEVTEMPGGLCGDGMILRKSAWHDLQTKGFRFTLTGNRGGSLNGCEDEELSLALRLAGWRFWYDPRLRLRQFLTADKLDWRHLRRRARNEGISSVALDPYYVALRRLGPAGTSGPKAIVDNLPAQWLWRSLWGFKDLARRPATLLMMPFLTLEGREQVLKVEAALSRIKQLLKLRGAYDLMVRQIGELR